MTELCWWRLILLHCQGTLTSMGVISVQALPADPLDALRELSRGEAELDRLRVERVRAARAAGASWEQVGEALGVTRQSAWEHFTARARGELAESAEANTELSDDEAIALAVDEVRSTRARRRPRR